MGNEAAVVARRWFEEVWNARRAEAIDELMERKAVGHMEGGDVEGPEGFRSGWAAFLAGLPDMHITIEDIVSEGDQAVVRWRVRASHRGELFGLAPTQRRVDVRGSSWFRIRDGKLAEGWDTWNLGGLLESLRSEMPPA
jgi:predicted ester cyclase